MSSALVPGFNNDEYLVTKMQQVSELVGNFENRCIFLLSGMCLSQKYCGHSLQRREKTKRNYNAHGKNRSHRDLNSDRWIQSPEC